jgi:hypothetical protein
MKLAIMIAIMATVVATSATAFPLHRCHPGYHRGLDLRCHWVGFRHDRFRHAEHPLRPTPLPPEKKPRDEDKKPMPYGGH